MTLSAQCWLRKLCRTGREFTCSEHRNNQKSISAAPTLGRIPLLSQEHTDIYNRACILFSWRTSQKFKPNLSARRYLTSATSAYSWAKEVRLSHTLIPVNTHWLHEELRSPACFGFHHATDSSPGLLQRRGLPGAGGVGTHVLPSTAGLWSRDSLIPFLLWEML